MSVHEKQNQCVVAAAVGLSIGMRVYSHCSRRGLIVGEVVGIAGASGAESVKVRDAHGFTAVAAYENGKIVRAGDWKPVTVENLGASEYARLMAS